MATVGILGAGSWGTALAVLLCRNGHGVTLWSHRPEEAEKLSKTRMNESKLPGVKLPEEIAISSDLEQTLQEKDVLVLAVPSAAMRTTCRRIAPQVKPGQILVDVSKGIEKGTFSTMTAMIEQEIPEADAAVLSGPSHAEEVGRQLPTTCVIGAHTEKTARYLQQIFMSPVFRVYISPDMLGIELGGALKNVIALAAGIADGLGYGDNAKAALITRGITEIARLGVKMGGRIETFSGLTGIGDLIVTCASMHSRNRRAGILIGQGYSMEEAMKEVNMVVEGVYSAQAAVELGQKYQVELPIIEQVYRVLFEGKNPREAVSALMLRDQKVENPLLPWETPAPAPASAGFQTGLPGTRI
ncbi:MAG: NAD(P)H-dependent glycerol-3-phosphate dehydrogenase [Lachnospiraceae bacterium]|nr:NAD(P)H-dependent glycerol-3-phosphate dehydrogenase [Lachnospiraceae bacterium]